MYRVLIVDDEPAIVKGMERLLSEVDSVELEIYKAYSALQALTIARKVRLDIVISDIRMPGMTGLEMHEGIIGCWPNCKVIFLSGYSDFEYAYSAIHKQVSNYILKTESDEVILKAVTDAIDKLKEEREQELLLENAKRQMKELSPLLRKELYEYALATDNVDSAMLKTRFQELELGFAVDKLVLLVVGRINGQARDVIFTEKLNTLYRVKDLVDKAFTDSVVSDCSVIENSRLALFIQPDFENPRFISDNSKIDWDSLVIYIKGTLETVQDICRDQYGFEVSFVLSRNPVGWSLLFEEYSLIKSVVASQYVQGQQVIMELGKSDELFSQGTKDVVSAQAAFLQKLKTLEASLESGNDGMVDQICRQLLGIIRNGFKEGYLLNIERYHQLLLMFVSYINRNNLFEYIEKDLNPNKLLTVSMPDDWDKEESFFTGLGRYLCMLKKKLEENRDSMVINKIHNYIAENPAGDLSLTKLAELVYFNPSYLSRFYKQATGKNLIDYINEHKVAIAKRLLAETNIKVNEIALKLGYESASYFTSFFRRMEGMTPQDYRMNIIGSEVKNID